MPASWFSQTEMGINSGWLFKSPKRLTGTAEQGNVRSCPFLGALNQKKKEEWAPALASQGPQSFAQPTFCSASLLGLMQEQE